MIASVFAALARGITGSAVEWSNDLSDDRQRIFIANHTSHLDFIVLWSHLPPLVRARTRPVAARDYWIQNSIRRYLAAEVFHAVLIERHRPVDDDTSAPGYEDPIQQMQDAMADGHSLILFPEGTRGKGDLIAPFRSGLFHLCSAQLSIEVAPVYIMNLNRILPKGQILPVPLLSRVIFGKPFTIHEGEEKGAFLEHCRAAVAELAPSS